MTKICCTAFFNIRTVLSQTEEQRLFKCVTKIQNTEPEKELMKTACSGSTKFSQNLVHTSVCLNNIYNANKMKQHEQRSNLKKLKEKKSTVKSSSGSHSSSTASKVCQYKLTSTYPLSWTQLFFKRAKGPDIGIQVPLIIFSISKT